MKRGMYLVLSADIWAGLANLPTPDLMQVIASTFAIACSTVYLMFYIYDRIKKSGD